MAEETTPLPFDLTQPVTDGCWSTKAPSLTLEQDDSDTLFLRAPPPTPIHIHIKIIPVIMTFLPHQLTICVRVFVLGSASGKCRLSKRAGKEDPPGESQGQGEGPWLTYNISRMAGMIRPGLARKAKILPRKVGKSFSIVSWMTSYILFFPL